MQDILLISLGGVFGANIRFLIYTKLEKINFFKDFRILIINTFSSFFLGFYLSIIQRLSYDNFSDQLALFFVIGFLGGLSTFSSFIYDLFDLFRQLKVLRAFKHLFLSLTLGIMPLAFGLLLGNQ